LLNQYDFRLNGGRLKGVGMAIGGVPATRLAGAVRAPAGKARYTPSAIAVMNTIAPAFGLTSRRNFERSVAYAMTQRDEQLLAVLDVDQFRLFKTLNGIAVADALLRTLSRRLGAAAAAVGGNLLRLGADEFAVVVPTGRLNANAGKWTRELLAAAIAPFAHRGAVLPFSATIGFALLPDHANTLADALHCARLAVAEGKQAGGGAVTPCTPVLREAARGRDELARDLRAAIAGGQIVPFYQPVVALDSGQISGLEVLARWIHPIHGVLQPGAFIPLAEEQGLCQDITRALLGQVQREARPWPLHWRFAFNTTPRDVIEMLTLIEAPESSAQAMIDPDRIELEVTETAIMRDLAEASDLLAAFQPRGVKLVLDDFGTGYANFQQLLQIPFARLKIDKSFIVDMLDDPRAAACVHAIIQLAHHLGMTATAEGVEFAAIADRLAAMGCDYAQGYHYARPMPACEVEWLLGEPRLVARGFDHAA
jgi:diguanylate cyclase (GGDEF)-like protein